MARRLGAAHVHLGANSGQRLSAGDRHRARRLLPWQGTRQSRVLPFLTSSVQLVYISCRTCRCHKRHARAGWSARSVTSEVGWCGNGDAADPLDAVCCSTRCTLTRGAGASSWRPLCPSTGCRASSRTCLWWWSRRGCLPMPSCCTSWSPCGYAALHLSQFSFCAEICVHMQHAGNIGPALPHSKTCLQSSMQLKLSVAVDTFSSRCNVTC